MKFKEILIVISSLGTILKRLVKRFELEIGDISETIQTTALLKSEKILLAVTHTPVNDNPET